MNDAQLIKDVLQAATDVRGTEFEDAFEDVMYTWQEAGRPGLNRPHPAEAALRLFLEYLNDAPGIVVKASEIGGVDPEMVLGVTVVYKAMLQDIMKVHGLEVE